MQDLTIEEKNIYNLWLKNFANVQGRPYKKRMDFSDLSEDKRVHLNNILIFIQRNKIKDVDEFFFSIFDYHKGFVDLDYFITPSASGIYAKYLNRKRFKKKSDDELKEEILNNLKMIAKKCLEKGVDLDKYLDITEEGHSVPLFILQLKNGEVCPVTMWAFPGFKNKFFDFPQDVRKFILTSELEGFIMSSENNLNRSSIREYLFEKYNNINKLITKQQKTNQ